MSTAGSIISTNILDSANIVDSGGWNPQFPPENIQHPSPKVSAINSAVSGGDCFVTFDTFPTSGNSSHHYNLFSALYLRNFDRTQPGLPGSTWRVRVNGSSSMASPEFDSGDIPLWDLGFTPGQTGDPNDQRLHTNYPQGVYVHIVLPSLLIPSPATDGRFIRFDFNDVTTGQFSVAKLAAAQSLTVGALWGSSAGTPVEESEDLWTWGDERIVRPGPKYDTKSWDVSMTEDQKERGAYLTLKNAGSSQPLIAVDELPEPYTTPNTTPWVTHQKTLYGTITRVSPIIYSGVGEFRSSIEFQEL